MAQAIGRKNVLKQGSGAGFYTEETAFCSECGAVVGRSQYGRDEECPECDAILDWDAEE